MTDVRKQAHSGDQKNNQVTVYTQGGRKVFTNGIDVQIPVSGVNGVTDNGYLDDRFDDPRYYSGPTSEEYVEKGY